MLKFLNSAEKAQIKKNNKEHYSTIAIEGSRVRIPISSIFFRSRLNQLIKLPYVSEPRVSKRSKHNVQCHKTRSPVVCREMQKIEAPAVPPPSD